MTTEELQALIANRLVQLQDELLSLTTPAMTSLTLIARAPDKPGLYVVTSNEPDALTDEAERMVKVWQGATPPRAQRNAAQERVYEILRDYQDHRDDPDAGVYVCVGQLDARLTRVLDRIMNEVVDPREGA